MQQPWVRISFARAKGYNQPNSTVPKHKGGKQKRGTEKEDTAASSAWKPVAHFNHIGLGHGPTFNYDITPKGGVLTFITRTENNLTRFVVTPDSNVDAMLAASKPAPVQN